MLPALYARALAGSPGGAPHPPTLEDEALLRDPTASAVWRLLREHFPERPLDLDIDLALDLNLDSFGGWSSPCCLHERAGVTLAENDLARIGTIRDLLRLSIDRRAGPAAPPPGEPALALDIEHWLAPTGPLLTVLGVAVYAVNRVVMRGLSRLRVAGIAELPLAVPCVIAPNHVSSLDSLVVAAALGWSRLRHVYWAGDAQRLFPHRLTRVFCRAVHLFPVDTMHPALALETRTGSNERCTPVGHDAGRAREARCCNCERRYSDGRCTCRSEEGYTGNNADAGCVAFVPQRDGPALRPVWLSLAAPYVRL